MRARRHAPRDHLRLVFAAPLQAGQQLVPARRQEEDEDRVREELLDLQRALPVDLEQHVVAADDAVFDGAARSAVEVAVHLGPLDELARRDHGAKRRLVDEVVLAPVLLLAARLSRGVRDRQHEVRIELEQGLDEARFAGAARRGDGEEVAGVVHGARA